MFIFGCLEHEVGSIREKAREGCIGGDLVRGSRIICWEVGRRVSI